MTYLTHFIRQRCPLLGGTVNAESRKPLQNMGWTRGLEPPTTGITSRGSTIELRPPYCVQVARLAGLEPATYSLEGCCSILLSYRRSPDRVIRLKNFERMVGAERFELPTLWSQTRCATRLRYAPNKSSCSKAADNMHLKAVRQSLNRHLRKFFSTLGLA